MSPLARLWAVAVSLNVVALCLTPKPSGRPTQSQAIASTDEVPIHFDFLDSEGSRCPQQPSIFQPILDAAAALPNVTNTEWARNLQLEALLLGGIIDGELREIPAVLAPRGEVRRDHPAFDYQASDGEPATVLARFQGRVELAGAYSFSPPDEREIRGNLVLICWNLWDNSPLLCALYAGLSRISVSEGQHVDFGDPIGDTGYGLHGGRNVNPMVHVALYGTRRGPLGPTLDEIKARATRLPR